MSILITFILLLVGGLWCLSGFKFCKQLMSILGFGIFSTLGYSVSGAFTDEKIYAIGLGILAGVIGASLSWTLVKIQTFLAGCFGGVLLVWGIILALNEFHKDAAILMTKQYPLPVLLCCAAAGLFLGGLAAKLIKPAIIILSAVSGAFLFVQELAVIFPIGKQMAMTFVIGSALVGIMIQSLSSGGLTDK